MINRNKHSVEVLRDIIRDQVLNCSNVITLDDLNGRPEKPEPDADKVLLTVKG